MDSKPVSSDSSCEQGKYDEHENEDKEDNVAEAEAEVEYEYEDDEEEEEEDEDEDEDEEEYEKEEDDEELKRIHNAMKQDNKDEFVELLNKRLSWDNKLQNSYWLSSKIYNSNAVKCFAAILDGETKVSNIADCLGQNPFPVAVCFRSDKITAFLLEREGYLANARYDNIFLTLLPLEYSLECLSLERSNAVKFITNLFGECWSDQKKRMKMVGVLAPKTREIKQLLFHNLKEGNMVEVGGLLLFAKQCVLSTSIVEGEFQSISEMHDFLSDEISSSNTQRICSGFNTKLKRKEETLLLLKILDKIGDRLSTLLQLNCFTYSAAMAVVSLIKHAGFDVKAEYLNNDSSWSRQLWYDVMKMDRENTNFTTYGLPGSPKAAAAVRDGLVQNSKWGTISSLPVLSEALLKTNCVSTTTLMASNPSITHLRKLNTVPFLGTLVKAFRRGFHF